MLGELQIGHKQSWLPPWQTLQEPQERPRGRGRPPEKTRQLTNAREQREELTSALASSFGASCVLRLETAGTTKGN